jgi:hypothetical protein
VPADTAKVSSRAVRQLHWLLVVVGATLATAGVVLVATEARPQAHPRAMALLAAIAAFGTAALLLSSGRRNAAGRLPSGCSAGRR